MVFRISLVLFLLLLNCPLHAENNDKFIEMYRISVHNTQDGAISISTDEGISWETRGKVIYPCNKVNDKGYTASKWGKTGCIAASAVNAIHIKAGENTEEDRGIVFSLIPKDLLNPPSYYNSFYSPDSSIYTDIPAGESIFGGDYSPFVGNPVSYAGEDNLLRPIEQGYVPKIGQYIVIDVIRPAFYPRSITFENWFGGAVRIDFGGGDEKVIGEVLKPVSGIGRFTGTQYTDVGRIRANHPGVIDISTSPLGRIGGFQIIPSGHGMSPEMTNARVLTQWMIIGPVFINGVPLEGQSPLFSYFIQPRYKHFDIDSPTLIKDMLGKTIVDVKLEGKEGWQPMPSYWLEPEVLPEWAGSALKNVQQIRILFPVEQ